MNIAREIDFNRNNLDKDFHDAFSIDITEEIKHKISVYIDEINTIKGQLNEEEISNKDFLGLVLDYDPLNNMVTLEQRNYFKVGDVVEFFGPNLEETTFTIPKELYDEKDNLIEVANHPQMIVKMKCPIPLNEFDMMRLKLFDISSFL